MKNIIDVLGMALEAGALVLVIGIAIAIGVVL